MATNYSGYNQSQYDNQSKYLNNLINSGTAGQKAWAQNELNSLNSQYSGNKSSGGSGYFMPTNQDGSGVHYNNTDVGTWDTSGQKWTNVGGTDGVNYAIANSNGTIIATDSNGVQTRFLPTSQDYNSFYQNMLADIQKAGNRYTPNTTYTNSNGTYTTKDYTAGNSDLQYALQQAAKTNPGISVEEYVKSLYNRIGQNNAAGTGVVTLADVNAELDRLGLSDYNSQNAIYTAGGTLLPGNQFIGYKDGNENTPSNSADSRWVTYGGQQYLLGGDSANLAAYANAKTGNVDNLALIFGNMANNPYAMQDPEFLMQYNQQLNAFNNAAGIQSSAPAGSLTGNQNVDNVINYWNSMNNYGNMAGGGSVGTSSLLELLQSYLDGGLEANKGFLEQQRALAQQSAEKAASDAYVNQMLQQDAVRQQMSALGLGTSGALQSAQMGIQGNYGNNLSEINSNLNTMLSSLSEQELQMLTDYYNNMANYAYQVTNDERDYAMAQAQLALQQQQAQYEQQMAERELALKLQQYAWEQEQYANSQALAEKQYADAMAQQQFDNNITLQELLLRQQAAKKSSGGGSSKSGGSTSSKKSSGITVTQQTTAANLEPIYNSMGFRNPLYIAEKYLY